MYFVSNLYRYNDMAVFHIDTESFEPVYVTGDSPSNRTWPATTTISDTQMFLFGGGTFSGFRVLTASNETWLFDYTTSTWTLKNPGGVVPPGLISCSATYHGGYVYVFGGVTITNHFSNDIYRYDPVEDFYVHLLFVCVT